MSYFGETSAKLVSEFASSCELLPPYNEEAVRQVIRECQMFFEQNRQTASSLTSAMQASPEDMSRYRPLLEWRHNLLSRNKRCLLAYAYARLMKLKEMRWEMGSVLPTDIKLNMSPLEADWFNNYNGMLARYMSSVCPSGLDLMQYGQPPKASCIEVRCLVDYGEFETESGVVIYLKKDTQHAMMRSECEHLIRQGVLEHVLP